MRLKIVNTVSVIIIIIICSRNINSSFNNININNIIVVAGTRSYSINSGIVGYTLKFWMFLLFVIVDVYKQYFTRDLKMCLLCLHSTFRVGNFSDSLAIDMKLKAKYELCAAAIVLCCVVVYFIT